MIIKYLFLSLIIYFIRSYINNNILEKILKFILIIFPVSISFYSNDLFLSTLLIFYSIYIFIKKESFCISDFSIIWIVVYMDSINNFLLLLFGLLIQDFLECFRNLESVKNLRKYLKSCYLNLHLTLTTFLVLLLLTATEFIEDHYSIDCIVYIYILIILGTFKAKRHISYNTKLSHSHLLSGKLISCVIVPFLIITKKDLLFNSKNLINVGNELFFVFAIMALIILVLHSINREYKKIFDHMIVQYNTNIMLLFILINPTISQFLSGIFLFLNYLAYGVSLKVSTHSTSYLNKRYIIIFLPFLSLCIFCYNIIDFEVNFLLRSLMVLSILVPFISAESFSWVKDE